MKIKLFENFQEDILNLKSNQIRLLNELKKEIKSEVDDYMNYITDEFGFDESGINIDLESESFEVYYMGILCNFSDKSLKEFISLLIEVDNRMKKLINAKILISSKVFPKNARSQDYWEELRYGSFINLEQFIYVTKNVLKDDLYIKIKCDIKVCNI
jgi:hypothetical protein